MKVNSYLKGLSDRNNTPFISNTTINISTTAKYTWTQKVPINLTIILQCIWRVFLFEVLLNKTGLKITLVLQVDLPKLLIENDSVLGMWVCLEKKASNYVIIGHINISSIRNKFDHVTAVTMEMWTETDDIRNKIRWVISFYATQNWRIRWTIMIISPG